MFERFGYDDTPQCVVLHQGVLSAYTGAIRGLPQGTRKVDFVIKPDPQVVFDRVDFPRVWNEEVVIRDVPVFWPPGIGTDK